MKLRAFILRCGAVLLSGVLALSLCGCASAQKKEIAVIVKSVDSDFWHNVKNGVDSAATEYNVTVTFEGPANEEDYRTQNDMIAAAADRGVDAILLSAIDFEQSAETVSEAARKGVKIFAIDSAVNAPQVRMFIGTDNTAAGRAAGEAATSGFASGEKICIGLVNYYERTDNGIRREQGFRDYIAALPNAKVVESVNVASNAESATAGALALLRDHPEINVLVGFNEWMTIGVGRAIAQQSDPGRVRGVGFDTNLESVGMLETGEMDALIVQNPFAIGYLGVKNAVEQLGGAGSGEKTRFTDVTIVTKENLYDPNIQKLVFRFS